MLGRTSDKPRCDHAEFIGISQDLKSFSHQCDAPQTARFSFTSEGFAGRFAEQVTQLLPRGLSADVQVLVSASDARFFRSFQRRELPQDPAQLFGSQNR
jgi:hypothetical protein